MEKTKVWLIRESCKDPVQYFQEVVAVIVIMACLDLLSLVNNGTETNRVSAACFAAKNRGWFDIKLIYPESMLFATLSSPLSGPVSVRIVK